MSSQEASPGQMQKNRSIDERIFLGVLWALLGIAFLSLLGRIFIKWRTFAKLSWDDLFVTLAFIFTLGTAITMQITHDYMYQLEYVRVGIIYPPPADFMADTQRYFTGVIAQGVFFNCSLWAVKFAFLLFFWRLISKIQSLRWQWYGVFAFTMLSFIGAFAAVDWRCIASPVEVIFATCGTSDAGVRMRFQMWFVCAIDVFSDMLILSIPFVLLWQVKLPIRKRISLMGLFSLVCVTMAIAFVRASQITTYKGQPDNSRTTLWSFVEQSIAVIILCLGSFRTLFTHDPNRRKNSYEYRHYPRNSATPKKPKHPNDITLGTTIETEITYAEPWQQSDTESGKGSSVGSEKDVEKHCETCKC